MNNKPKARGTAAETAVLRYLTANGVTAHRVVLHGAKDHGDIHATLPGRTDPLVIEVKSRKGWPSARQIEAWLVETDIEALNAGAACSALVVKRPGSGAANAADWLCYLRADEWDFLTCGTGHAPTSHWVCVNLAHLVKAVKGS